MKSKMLALPADMGGPPYSPACVITHTFLLNTGVHLIWDREKQL